MWFIFIMGFITLMIIMSCVVGTLMYILLNWLAVKLLNWFEKMEDKDVKK